MNDFFVQAQEDRGVNSQNISTHLRHLIEAVILGLDGKLNDEVSYYDVGPSKDRIGKSAKYHDLIYFHKLVTISVSHYLLSGDGSERLMLKYFTYLEDLRSIVANDLGLEILQNLELFPLDQDPALKEYYEAIAAQIDAVTWNASNDPSHRYYIDSVRPFITERGVFYEVTFRYAREGSKKVDRRIAFTKRKIDTNYATKLWLYPAHINVAGQELPIDIIENHEVSIRPIELMNLARLYGSLVSNITSSSREYANLCSLLTKKRLNLLEIVLASETDFECYLKQISRNAQGNFVISDTLRACRETIGKRRQGQNLLRYLLFTMRNQVIKLQLASDCDKTMRGDLYVKSACYPFEKMPFALNPYGHRARIADLLLSIPVAGREAELLHRKVQNYVNRTGEIYVPVNELVTEEHDSKTEDDLKRMIEAFNSKATHQPGRKMAISKKHVVIAEYEEHVSKILNEIKKRDGSDSNYTEAVKDFLGGLGVNDPDTDTALSPGFDDKKKIEYLENLFSASSIALIYGPAGTGKSTMIDMVAQYFQAEDKLFLAHTKSAVDNLRRRVSDHSNSKFRTISFHLARGSSGPYSLLVVDECGIVSNRMMLEILQKIDFRYLLLVGDNYQLEPIEFGNWFDIVKSIDESEEKKKKTKTEKTFSVFELEELYRAKNDRLKELWKSVRELDGEIEERLSKQSFTKNLDASLFRPYNPSDDEITLCLNYDGLYGINNINRFMQESNPNPAWSWNSSTYKVGDPVLFYDSDRFDGVVFNNLKGVIVDIQMADNDRISFDVDIDRPEEDIRDFSNPNGRHIQGSVVRFYVDRTLDSDQEIEDMSDIVPFQIAYAVSIHKAQGLEFDSVRIVITSDAEDRITHNVFYTAITRARNSLTIYWSPESQKKIVESFERRSTNKTIQLLRTNKRINF